MDGRQVKDVEAHPRQVGKPLLGGLEGARAPVATGRSREHLVPGAEAGQRRVDEDLQLTRVAGRRRAVRVAADQRLQLGRQGRLDGAGAGSRPAGPELAGRGAERGGIGATGAGGSGLDQAGSDLQVHRHVLARLDPLGEVADPAPEVIDPGLQREAVRAQGGGLELALPAVVGQGRHRRLGPFALAHAAVQKKGGEDVVTVGEAVRLDPHPLAQRSLRGIAAGLDLGGDSLDYDAAVLSGSGCQRR